MLHNHFQQILPGNEVECTAGNSSGRIRCSSTSCNTIFTYKVCRITGFIINSCSLISGSRIFAYTSASNKNTAGNKAFFILTINRYRTAIDCIKSTTLYVEFYFCNIIF